MTEFLSNLAQVYLAISLVVWVMSWVVWIISYARAKEIINYSYGSPKRHIRNARFGMLGVFTLGLVWGPFAAKWFAKMIKTTWTGE